MLERSLSPTEMWNIGLFLVSAIVSNVGVWMQRITVAWLMWQLTASSTWLGLLAFAEVLPFVTIGLLGGVAIDRYGCVRVMRLGLAALASLAGLLSLLYSLDVLYAWGLLLVVFAAATVQAAVSPANQILILRLFKADNAARIIPLYSVTFNIARFLGPLAALAIIQFGSLGAVFLVNAASYLPAAMALSLYVFLTDVGTSRSNVRNDTPSVGILADAKAGIAYAIREPLVRALLSLMFLTSLVGRPFMELIPAIADLSFGRGDDGAMLLMSAAGIGALAGGIGLFFIKSMSVRLWCLLGTSLILSGALLALAVVDDFDVARAIVSIAGFSAVANGIITIVLLQVLVDGAHRGRITSLYFASFRAGLALGALFFGILVDWWGLNAALLLGAITTGGVAAGAATFVAKARKTAAFAPSAS